MKRTYIAAAIAALASGVVLADSGNVTITGKLEMGYHNFRAAGDTVTQNKIDDGGSEIDFKGTEDLGNGMKAIWQINNDVVADGTGAKTWASGDTFVGLSGGFGAVKLGKGINAYGDGYYKANFYIYDDSPREGGLESGANGGAVKYETPAFGGFSGAISWGAGEDKTSSTKATDAWAVAGTYEAENWGVHAAYATQTLSSTTKGKDWVLAGKLSPMAGLTVSAEYDQYKPTGSPTQKSLGLYGEYKPSKFAFRALAIRTKNDGNVDGVKRNEVGLGVSYDLSKRTALLAEYRRIKTTGTSAQRDLFIGMHHDF